MPSLVYTPELARNVEIANKAFIDADRLLSTTLPHSSSSGIEDLSSWHTELTRLLNLRAIQYSPFSFFARLHLQDIIYKKISENGHDIQSQSILSQINNQFSPVFENNRTLLTMSRGILFLDFDNTLWNWSAYIAAARMHEHMLATAKCASGSVTFPIDESYYNGGSKATWLAALSALKKKGFSIVLCTNRAPLIGEDAAIKFVLNGLSSVIDRVLFISSEHKGSVMDTIWDYMKTNYNLEFPKSSFYLIDDNLANLNFAKEMGFSTIKTYPAEQIEFRKRRIGTAMPSFVSKVDYKIQTTLVTPDSSILKGLIPSISTTPNFLSELDKIPILPAPMALRQVQDIPSIEPRVLVQSSQLSESQSSAPSRDPNPYGMFAKHNLLGDGSTHLDLLNDSVEEEKNYCPAIESAPPLNSQMIQSYRRAARPPSLPLSATGASEGASPVSGLPYSPLPSYNPTSMSGGSFRPSQTQSDSPIEMFKQVGTGLKQVGSGLAGLASLGIRTAAHRVGNRLSPSPHYEPTKLYNSHNDKRSDFEVLSEIP